MELSLGTINYGVVFGVLAQFVTVALVLWRFRAHWPSFLPSLFWFVLMGLPLALDFAFRSSPQVDLQIFGVLSMAVFLLLGDRLALFWMRPNSDSEALSRVVHYLVIGLVLMTVAVQVYHVWAMPRIPIFALFQGESMVRVRELREAAGKLLPISSLAVYFSHSMVAVFLPISVWYFYRGRMWGRAASLLVWTLFYSAATTAKSVALTFGVVLAAIALLQTRAEWRPRTRRFFGASAVAIPLVALMLLVVDRSSILWIDAGVSAPPEVYAHVKSFEAQGLSVTWSDHYRMFRESDVFKSKGESGNLLNYLVYRAILTPVDVAHRWYAYFPEQSGGFLGLSGLTPGSRGEDFVHPANRVGVWAYLSRYPAQYLPSTRAYASVDADAYSRGGRFAIWIVGLLALAYRLLIAWLPREDFGRALGAALVLLLAVLLPQASMQAILVAQGGLFGILILSALFTLNRFRTWKANGYKK